VLLVSTASAALVFTTSKNYDENTYAANIVDRDAFNTAGNATLVAAGQIINLATFSTDVSAAFLNDLGGIINFDQGTDATPYQSFTASYGTSQSKTLTATMTSSTGVSPYGSGFQLVPNITTAAMTTSGVSGLLNHMGSGSGSNNFGIAFDVPLSEIGVTWLQRTASRTASVKVILDDGSSIDFAQESQTAWVPANGDPDQDTFFGAKAPAGRAITAIRFGFSAASRIDDLAFVVAVPEPSSYIMVLAGLACLGIVFRKAKR
jgi:hypothetical protein